MCLLNIDVKLNKLYMCDLNVLIIVSCYASNVELYMYIGRNYTILKAKEGITHLFFWLFSRIK